ncbi:MAG: DUF4160 domain-containing protein, partial [Acidimicrobiales bacterium]
LTPCTGLPIRVTVRPAAEPSTTPGRVTRRRYRDRVPRLSAFYGIVIYMYIRDHRVAHFHARHGDDEAVFEVATGKVLAGRLRPRLSDLRRRAPSRWGRTRK